MSANCIEEDRRMTRIKDLILMSIFSSKLNMDIAISDVLQKARFISGKMEVEGLALSGGLKRKNTSEINMSAKKSK